MCKLRLITKSSDNNIVNDEEIALDKVVLSSLDRPSYAIYSQGTARVDFVYPNSSEDYLQKESDDGHIVFGYGRNSGRCVYVIIHEHKLFDTQKFNLGRKIISEDSNQRFKNNVSNFLNLIQQLLTKIKL